MEPVFSSKFSISSILENEEDNRTGLSPVETDIRPEYTYPELVTMAIRSSPEQKLTLSGIQQWISDEFPFYRQNQRGWQCQVRHTLTRNSSFMKIPRPSSDPGRGNYWTINPEAESVRKRASPGQTQICVNYSITFDSSYSVEQAIVQGVPHPQMPTARYFPTPQEIERAQQIMMTQEWQEQNGWFLYHQRQAQLLQQQLLILQHQQFQQQCEEIYKQIIYHQQQCACLNASTQYTTPPHPICDI